MRKHFLRQTYDAFSTCSVYDNCQKSIDSTDISAFLKYSKNHVNIPLMHSNRTSLYKRFEILVQLL